MVVSVFFPLKYHTSIYLCIHCVSYEKEIYNNLYYEIIKKYHNQGKRNTFRNERKILKMHIFVNANMLKM